MYSVFIWQVYVVHLSPDYLYFIWSHHPRPLHNACQGRPSSSAAPRACRDDVMSAVSVTLGPRWLFKCSLVKTKLLISHRAHKLQVKSVKALSVICLGTETDPFKNWKSHTCKQTQLSETEVVFCLRFHARGLINDPESPDGAQGEERKLVQSLLSQGEK